MNGLKIAEGSAATRRARERQSEAEPGPEPPERWLSDGDEAEGSGIVQGSRGHVQHDDDHDDQGRQHRAVPARERGAADPRPRRDRPARGQLHGVHAVRAQLPRLVHLHRGSQGARSAATCRRRAAQGEQARPLRHRLRAVHVLRHLRRGVPVRRPVLEPGVRVLRAAHRRSAARQGQARRVDGDGARSARARGRAPTRRARSDRVLAETVHSSPRTSRSASSPR